MQKSEAFAVIIVVMLMFSFMCSIISLENAWNMRTAEDLSGGSWCDRDMLNLDTCYSPTESYTMALSGLYGSFIFLSILSIIVMVKR